jgi:DNA-binding transcriptional ArsR family regulator
MEKRVFKDNIYTAIAGLTKAFSNGNRLEILDLLASGEKTVEQVAANTTLSVANASQHLQVLKQARLVKSRRQGNFIFYHLDSTKSYAAWKALRDLALEADPAVQAILRQYRQEAGSPESFTLRTLPGKDRILLVDVRPAAEFTAGSLPGAVSIPIAELPQRLEELPSDRIIVAYCRGAFCTFADEAVELLKAKGFDAVRLEESYLDLLLLNQ